MPKITLIPRVITYPLLYVTGRPWLHRLHVGAASLTALRTQVATTVPYVALGTSSQRASTVNSARGWSLGRGLGLARSLVPRRYLGEDDNMTKNGRVAESPTKVGSFDS
ncbi:hypothetical protein L484_018012 [Morus notabilis]|uniref:Uncharacterized protein n=1 Tax=Morus notabilis TaxID=981085 RepID=W9S7P6_9ROSA|nr:hypothetical protein L484_018012 [Morus notabilis]